MPLQEVDLFARRGQAYQRNDPLLRAGGGRSEAAFRRGSSLRQVRSSRPVCSKRLSQRRRAAVAQQILDLPDQTRDGTPNGMVRQEEHLVAVRVETPQFRGLPEDMDGSSRHSPHAAGETVLECLRPWGTDRSGFHVAWTRQREDYRETLLPPGAGATAATSTECTQVAGGLGCGYT